MRGLIPFNRRKNELFANRSPLNNMLEDFFSDEGLFSRNFLRDSFKVDVCDAEKEYVVQAEIPGVNKEDVEVEMEKGRLTIAVKKEENKEEEGKNYIHKERRTSAMSRSIYLADAQDSEITAKLENGILEVKVPKVEKVTTTKKITVE
ncbi:Hsp20 family protein [Succinispira mobilis]|uniref:Hsp20 family protein n=1 Tax=Succinispira mobilis TaxID=78120 RepID=UPI000360E02B|nr:Hsp20 family protein [Succinispira mobilis]